jgi:hypothetical protein
MSWNSRKGRNDPSDPSFVAVCRIASTIRRYARNFGAFSMYLEIEFDHYLRRNNMSDAASKRFTGSFFVGLLLLTIGTLFLLENLDVIYFDHLSSYWPVIVIAFGVMKLLDAENMDRRADGFWWIYVGVWLLVSTTHFLGLSFHNSWPLLIIGWGISMLWKSTNTRTPRKIVEEHYHGN